MDDTIGALAHERVRPLRLWRRRLRDAAVLSCSAGVVAFLGAYALADPGYELAVAPGDVSAHAGSQAVVRGRIVDDDGEGVSGARLVVHRAGGGARETSSGRQGFFRLDVYGPCTAYDIALLASAHGRSLRTRLRHKLCPGQSLSIDARVTTQGQFIWMPR